MNGPNVNWSFLRLFQETYEKNPGLKQKRSWFKVIVSEILWIACLINGAFTYGYKHSGWEIHKLLKSLYWLFKYAPARSSKFTEVTGEPNFQRFLSSSRDREF